MYRMFDELSKEGSNLNELWTKSVQSRKISPKEIIDEIGSEVETPEKWNVERRINDIRKDDRQKTYMNSEND
jgi:hypothetical protein